MLENEIHEVFGEEIYIAEDTVYANVIGFLTKLCSRVLDIMIPDAIEIMDKMNSTDVIYSDDEYNDTNENETGEIN